MSQPLTTREPAPVREPTVVLEDLTSGLLWPGLVRGPALALRPERLITGIACAVVLGLLGEASRVWNAQASFSELIGRELVAPFGSLAAAVLGRSPELAVSALLELRDGPVDLFVADPWATVFLGLVMAAVWGVFGAAIARSTACEVALGRVVGGAEALGFGLSRWASTLGAVAAPIAVIGFIHLVIAVGGAALLTWPVGNVVGAVLFVAALGLGLIAVLIGLGYLLGWVMLVPAIACEGTDALDSIQRTYAYVVSRPLRLVWYLVVALAVGAAATVIVGWVLGASDGLATAAARQWSGDAGAAVLTRDPTGEGASGITGFAARVVGFWRAVLAVVLAGFVITLINAAGTQVYLLCRRINDGQEPAELWTPDAGS